MKHILAVAGLILVTALGAQAQEFVPPGDDDTPGRTGNNSIEACLRDPESCPNFNQDDYASPAGAPVRGEGEELTPDEKLQRFIQQFECGETENGICVEKAE